MIAYVITGLLNTVSTSFSMPLDNQLFYCSCVINCNGLSVSFNGFVIGMDFGTRYISVVGAKEDGSLYISDYPLF